jgi:hypothetical protein
MTMLFERLRLQAHLTGLRERVGPEAADQVLLDVLERSWAKIQETPAREPEHADSE